MDLTEYADIAEVRNSLNRALKALEKERERTERIATAVYTAVEDVARSWDLPPVKRPAKGTAKKVRPEVAVPWLSDLQLGKITPDYNSDVCRQRVEDYAHKVIEIVDLHRKVRPIDSCHIWSLGDIVEGEDIYPGQEWQIDSSLYMQTVKNGPEILAGFIRSMLAHFQNVHFVGVIGNHGRIGRKGVHHPETNTDRMVYSITRTMLQPDIDAGRLTFDFSEPMPGDRGWYAVDQIGNYSCLLLHGDQFRGSLGVPWYGVRKKVLGYKSMAAAGGLPFPDFDDVAFGHWHQPVSWRINSIGVRGCGSTESWNDFAAENLASMGRASQRLMFVDPKEGIVTASYDEIWLD